MENFEIMENKSIEVLCWLKNNEEWYYPNKKVDLTEFDNVELISLLGKNKDLFYGHNNSKLDGRLFRGTWNNGLK